MHFFNSFLFRYLLDLYLLFLSKKLAKISSLFEDFNIFYRIRTQFRFEMKYIDVTAVWFLFHFPSGKNARRFGVF